MPEINHIALASVSANTEIDLSSEMDQPFDTREGVDPVVDAKEEPVADATAGTDYTSIGQGAASDAGAGEIVVTGPYTVAFGSAIDADAIVSIDYDDAASNQVVNSPA